MDNRRLPLLYARIAKGLTSRQLAALVGVSHTIVIRLENSWQVGTSPDVKRRICEVLDLAEFPERAA